MPLENYSYNGKSKCGNKVTIICQWCGKLGNLLIYLQSLHHHYSGISERGKAYLHFNLGGGKMPLSKLKSEIQNFPSSVTDTLWLFCFWVSRQVVYIPILFAVPPISVTNPFPSFIVHLKLQAFIRLLVFVLDLSPLRLGLHLPLHGSSPALLQDTCADSHPGIPLPPHLHFKN